MNKEAFHLFILQNISDKEAFHLFILQKISDKEAFHLFILQKISDKDLGSSVNTILEEQGYFVCYPHKSVTSPTELSHEKLKDIKLQ